MVVQCCVCRKVRDGSRWNKPPKGHHPETVSHGYCPVCAAEAFAEIRRYLDTRRGNQAGAA
jgi:hypothetical protein